MRKIFGICICLILLVGAIIAPTVAFAAETSNSAGVTIHFLNPTAIAVLDGNLFVADNVDENNSAIHCFDVSGSKAQWLYTLPLTEKIVNLATKNENSLYAVFTNKIVEYAVSDKLNESATITNYTNLVDVTYGVDGSKNNEYILTADALYRKNVDGTVTTKAITGSKSCVAIGNYIYYLYTDENGAAVCKSFEGSEHSTPNGDTPQGYLNNSDFLNNFAARGLFVYENDKLAIFDGTRICSIDMGATCSLIDIFDYQAQHEQENKKEITDVVASDNRLYVLNDSYQVDVYEKGDQTFALVDTVGDDTVKQSVPTEYTSFTLVRSKGYPTNLVYKTTDESTTVEDIIKNANEFIILGFDGDNTNNYYYVLIGNKFGWVQKSEGATMTNGTIVDSNLEVVNTTVTRDSNVQYVTKFASLNAVYIYRLPRSADSFRDETFTQTGSTMPEVTVLQRFTETTDKGEIIWYYVSFNAGEHTRTGFVQQKDLGEFMPTPSADLKAIGDKKINSTLFEAVKVHLYPDVSDNNFVTTDDGIVKLYSGRRVTVLSEENGVSLIEINYGDGSKIYGYVASNRLIGLHAMTTNAIVGITLLAVAIAIATTLIVIFVKRKNGTLPKRKKEPKTEE